MPDLGGSHDVKVGYEFQIDSSRFGSNANSGHIRYLDDSTNSRPFHVDRIMLFSMPAEGAITADNRIAGFPGMEASYDTVQVALDRRFTRGFLLQASFDYQWRDEFRSASEEARSPLVADPLVVGSGGHGPYSASRHPGYRHERADLSHRSVREPVRERDDGASASSRRSIRLP